MPHFTKPCCLRDGILDGIPRLFANYPDMETANFLSRARAAMDAPGHGAVQLPDRGMRAPRLPSVPKGPATASGAIDKPRAFNSTRNSSSSARFPGCPHGS
ncbi:MAG: hypothetical protein ACREDM_09650 [Methylocella sp.]